MSKELKKAFEEGMLKFAVDVEKQLEKHQAEKKEYKARNKESNNETRKV